MSAHVVLLHIWQALYDAPDETAANRLIERLADPTLRARAREMWAEHHERSVITLETSA